MNQMRRSRKFYECTVMCFFKLSSRPKALSQTELIVLIIYKLMEADVLIIYRVYYLKYSWSFETKCQWLTTFDNN